ncbi:phosphoglycerate kinase [bacterium]|nr:phosphoglycerate kinase [bacterium]
MAKLFIEDLEFQGRKALIRVDFNVPLDEKKNITDDTRIRAALPTIKYVLEKGGCAILMSHLGRPKGTGFDPQFSLKPAADHLATLLGKPVTMAPDCVGPEVEAIVAKMKPGDVTLLENVRFHKAEQGKDAPEVNEAFAKNLAKLGDLYVDDAFGTAHRPDASMVGVTKHVAQCAAGYLLQKEIKYLSEAVESPQRPFVAILGGAKVSDKIPVIENLLTKADTIIIGGAMAYTFLKAKGVNVGRSLVEPDFISVAKEFIEKAAQKGAPLILPVDHVVANAIDNASGSRTTENEHVPDGMIAVDIGPHTQKLYADLILKAKTIVWNGPMGVFETPEFAKGTFAIAKAVADSGAVSIVGGGDSVSAVNKSGVAAKISHISTGGGASLEYLEGKVLPGIAALSEK